VAEDLRDAVEINALARFSARSPDLVESHADGNQGQNFTGDLSRKTSASG